MIEDFDAYGNVKSSTPIQFLAQVWKPNIPTGIVTGRSSMISPRILTQETENVCWPNCFPMISDDDDDDYDDGKKKRHGSQLPVAQFSSVSYSTTTTAYSTTTTTTTTPYSTTTSGSTCPSVCTPGSVAFIDSAVPLDGTEVDVTSGRFDMTFVATSKNADIAVYTYQGPVGFQCGAIDQAMVSFIILLLGVQSLLFFHILKRYFLSFHDANGYYQLNNAKQRSIHYVFRLNQKCFFFSFLWTIDYGPNWYF